MTLADEFSSIFSEPEAISALLGLVGRTHLSIPTFSLSTTSLRHLPKWYERLDEIDNGIIRDHGNFLSDPAVIGLVDRSVTPPALTNAGREFLNTSGALHDNEPAAEYQLTKILYFEGRGYSPDVLTFLNEKRNHLKAMLLQFGISASRHHFLEEPRLLVVAEIVSGFKGALANLIQLPAATLEALANLGEQGFKNLLPVGSAPAGIHELCNRIGNEYTRAPNRRLNFLISIALLEIAESIPSGTAIGLVVPFPFSNLLTETDLHERYGDFTNEMSIWFDGVNFRVSASPIAPFASPVTITKSTRSITVLTLDGLPAGTGTAPPISPDREARKAPKQPEVTYISDLSVSERAEDAVEQDLLSLGSTERLVRVGHRIGETKALPDGMVPGADFYSVDASGKITIFREVKTISARPPATISLTRAEYMRIKKCAGEGIPYELILVDVPRLEIFEIGDIAPIVSGLNLSQVPQFSLRIGEGTSP